MSRLSIWDARESADVRAWTSLWDSWPSREVFAQPSYVTLWAGPEARPVCAAWESGEGCVLFPFLLRDLTAEPYWSRDVGRARDVTTPYGYGGAFFWGDDSDAVAERFWAAYDDWAADEGVVSEFVRLALFEGDLLRYPGEREEKLANAVRTLDPDPDALWMDVEHKVRKNVKKARRSGVVVELDETGDRLDDFLALYHRTMDRRGARPEYFFPRSYFEQLQHGLAGQYVYFHAVYDGSLASTELVLVSARTVYSFLGGTDERAFAVRPNDLLKYEITLWAKSAGKSRFVLGGGFAPEDGVFRHKLAFAPSGRVPFYVGRRVLHPDAYERLVEARRRDPAWTPRAGYFPLYRA